MEWAHSKIPFSLEFFIGDKDFKSPSTSREVVEFQLLPLARRWPNGVAQPRPCRRTSWPTGSAPSDRSQLLPQVAQLSLREVVELCACACGFGMLTLLSGWRLVGVPCAGAVRDGIEQRGGPPPA